MLKILALDPGSKNTGWAVVSVKLTGGQLRFRIEEFGKLVHPIKDLKGNIAPAIKQFRDEVTRIKRKHNATCLWAERFQSRGLRGKTIEAVTLMLGVLTQMKWDYYEFITAGTWKNQYNRIHGKGSLDAVYIEVKGKRIEPHEVDGVCIGIFGGSKQLKAKPFQFESSLVARRMNHARMPVG